MSKKFLELKTFNGATFSINDESKTYSIFKLYEMNKIISKHLKNCASIIQDLEYYKDYESKVDSYLDQQEDGIKKAKELLASKKSKDDKEDLEFETNYSIGGNFASYMELSFNVGDLDVRMADNGKAAEVLAKEYTAEYGENTLEFDPESSYCYVYTKNREEAKKFLLLTYNKYIKETLEPWYDGFEEFIKEYKTKSKTEQQNFLSLMF